MVKMEGPGNKHERNLEIVDLLKNTDMTYKQIGEKYGISRERVRQIRVKYGLPGRMHGKHG